MDNLPCLTRNMSFVSLETHVNEALWMEGVWLWADHFQAIHSQSPILWFTKLLRHPPKKLPTDGILADEKSMFARWRAWLFIPSYESIYVGFQRFPEGCLSSQWSSLEATLWVPSKSYTNALIQPVEFHFGSVIKRGLRLMTSALGSTFQKEEVRVQTIPLASSPS